MLAIKSTLLTVFRLIFANTRGGGGNGESPEHSENKEGLQKQQFLSTTQLLVRRQPDERQLRAKHLRWIIQTKSYVYFFNVMAIVNIAILRQPYFE